jgi:Amt family ammonium transporter
MAALAGSIYLGPRKERIDKAASIPYVILGTGLLWFGWFGFNAGSSLGANETATLAFLNTNTASAIAMLTWMFLESLLQPDMSASVQQF